MKRPLHHSILEKLLLIAQHIFITKDTVGYISLNVCKYNEEYIANLTKRYLKIIQAPIQKPAKV